MSLSIQTLTQNLSFSPSLRVSSLCFSKPSIGTLNPPSPVIRMGGGPRTFPGGVSKWQWKRMQAKKAKQLLKARLCRERQIYEMRKRAELRAAVSDLERPWEVVERAPTLFSVSADEQLKVLADRFQRPGGFDMWTDNDGPELFRSPDELPSARFFPKGVVHSVKPYQRVSESDLAEFEDNESPEDFTSSDSRNSGEGRASSSSSSVRSDFRSFDSSNSGVSQRKIGALSSNSSVPSDWEGRFDKLDLEDKSLNESASLRGLSGDQSRFRGQLRVVSGNERPNSRYKKKQGSKNLLPSGSSRSAFSMSEGSFGDSDGKLEAMRNGNDGRSYEGRFGRRSVSSGHSRGSSNSNNSSGFRVKENLRTTASFGSNGGKDGVPGQQRNSRYRSSSFTEGENGNERSLDSRSSKSNNSYKQRNGDSGRRPNGRSFGSSNSRNGSTSSESGLDRNGRGSRGSKFPRSDRMFGKGNGARTTRNSASEVYDMSLEHDGSYRFQSKNGR